MWNSDYSYHWENIPSHCYIRKDVDNKIHKQEAANNQNRDCFAGSEYSPKKANYYIFHLNYFVEKLAT
jgi:hypothetical protein